MRLSGKAPRSGMSVPQWHHKNNSTRYVKFVGTVSILFGLLFIIVGIAGSDLATASGGAIEPAAITLEANLFEDEAELNPFKEDIGKPALSANNIDIKLQLKTVEEKDFSNKKLGKFRSQVKEKEGRVNFDTAIHEKKETVETLGARVPKDYFLQSSEIEWFDYSFLISHYTFALEYDPLYANDKKVSVPGLPDDKKFREGFVFGGRGIIQQGTGVTEDGQFITIDWQKSYYDPHDTSKNRWVFKYGQGRPVTAWESVAVKHPDLPPGTRIVIENYGMIYQFVVQDTGLDLSLDQIDIFVGYLTIAQADQLGVQRSRVGIVRPEWEQAAENAGN